MDNELITDHPYSPWGPEYQYCGHPVDPDPFWGPMECGASRGEHKN